MARALRQDIPSHRARHAMPQLAPGMADLNPAPGVGRTGPPPLDSLDQAPAGSFQANRALNGERGVAARQQAWLHYWFSGGSATSREPIWASPAFDWDPDAFPADSDLFGATSTGTRRLGPLQANSGDDQSSPDVPPHSARLSHDSGLEGRGADVPRGRGPIQPSSPDSTGDVGSIGAFPGSGTCGALVCVRVHGTFGALSLCSPGLLVPISLCVFAGTFGAHFPIVRGDVWCPGAVSVGWALLLASPGLHACVCILHTLCLSLVSDLLLVADSEPSEWGGIDGEDRFLDPPALGPPFELRSTRDHVPSSQRPNEVEQFRTASRSQRRLSLSAVEESPTS
ncbi:hypothetical protein FB446DRAFT_794977 [Lentinula raphanica]|nr:hypothetical protein FB446DRAFT_794977 [Lentinula raphanica]